MSATPKSTSPPPAPGGWRRSSRTALLRRLPAVEDDRECWRSIPGYDGRYEASDQGRIRSIARDVALHQSRCGALIHHRCSVDLIATPDRNGRLQVSLSRDGVTRDFGVGRLVLEAFGEAAPQGWWIAYADNDKSNCSLNNLSWRPRGSARARLT